VGTLAGIALLEAALRGWTRSSRAAADLFLEWDPMGLQFELLGDEGYRPRPGATFHYPNGTIAHENSRGYRGPEVPVPKASGVFRIVMLGGSTTHGYGVEDAHTIDAQLRLLLARQHPKRRFEVVNLGFDGYDAACDYERLRADGLSLQPDAVIVHSGINDIPPARLPPPLTGPSYDFRARLKPLLDQRRRGGPSTWDRVKHASYAARAPGVLKHAILAKLRGLSSVPAPLSGPAVPPASAGDRFEASLRRIASIADPGIVLLFSTPPSALHYPAPLPTIPPSNLIVDAVTTQRYRDALDARMRRIVRDLAGAGRKVAYVPHDVPVARFMDDCHLDREGNLLVARDLATALMPWVRD
jgi:lysophospholipase L1-like esterase